MPTHVVCSLITGLVTSESDRLINMFTSRAEIQSMEHIGSTVHADNGMQHRPY